MTENFLLEVISDNPYQPRTVDNAEHIENLARSIAADDLLQVPTARSTVMGIQLAFGHSRRKAFEWLRSNFVKEGLPSRYNNYTEMPLNIAELSDEDMYRQAVSENVQRKDLDAIEMAKAMLVYRDQFSKNSDEIGALFGMSGATVRGKLRLLDLPDTAKAKLAAGAISEGTARTLLSMQKIATEKQIEETLKAIDANEDGELPDVIIDNAVDNLDNVIELWRDDRGGKPRGAWRNSWLLDMKNFPNKLLPELTIEDYAEVFDLEDEMNAGSKHKRVWNCLNKAKSTADLINMWRTSDFEDDHPRAEKVEHLINPPACMSCPFYTKVRGTHYCGMKVCHERKSVAWNQEIIRAGSKNLGIEIYQETDGAYVVLDAYKDGHKSLFKKRHKDLRLIMKDQASARGYTSQYGFDGVNDDVFLVIATGESETKLREKSPTSLKGTVDRAAQRRAKMFRAKRKELIWEFCVGVKSMFETLGANVLEELNDWKYIGVDDRPLVDEDGEDKKAEGMDDAEHLRCMLVWRLVNEQTGFDERNKQTKVVHVAKHLDTLANKWGVKAPKDLMKSAEQMDKDIEPVAAETPAKKK